MGESCSTYLSLRLTGKLHTGFLEGDVRERDHLGYLVVDGG
jgi:hypothetical protein